MKHTFILLLMSTVIGSLHAQDADKLTFHAGLELGAASIQRPKLDQASTFWNYGLITELHIKKQWIIHLNVSHSIRNYEQREEGLLLGSDIINGTTAYYASIVEEKLLEIENVFKYHFSRQKLTPFFGLGYAIQIPYAVGGERKIVHSDGMIEELTAPETMTSSKNLGAYGLLGINYELADRANLIIDLGYKRYFNSSLATYSFPASAQNSNQHDSLMASLGFLYCLK